MGSNTPTEGSTDFGVMLGSLWDEFGVILGSLWDEVGVILGSLWDEFGIILGSLWDEFGVILVSPKNHFLTILGSSKNIFLYVFQTHDPTRGRGGGVFGGFFEFKKQINKKTGTNLNVGSCLHGQIDALVLLDALQRPMLHFCR